MHLSRRCGAKTRSGSPRRSPGDAERQVPHARRRLTRSPEGEENGNYRHGCFNEAIALRRELGSWLRLMKKFAEEVE